MEGVRGPPEVSAGQWCHSAREGVCRREYVCEHVNFEAARGCIYEDVY